MREKKVVYERGKREKVMREGKEESDMREKK